MNGSNLRQTASRLALVALAGTATIGLLAASPALAAPDCPSQITACGCTITTPGGTYIVSRDLHGALDGVCIDIAAPRTVLEIINHSALTGGAKSGIGVLVEKGADYSVVAGIKRVFTPPPPTPPGPIPIPPVPAPGDEASITNFNTGIEVDANNVVVEFFDHLNGNHLAGLLLNGASNATAGGFCADKNDIAGVAVVGTTGSRIYNFTAEQNGLDGALLNDSNSNSLYNFTTILNATDGVALEESSSNSLTTGSSQSNGADGVRVGCGPVGLDPYDCDSSDSNFNHVTTIAAGQLPTLGIIAGDNCEPTFPARRPKQVNGIHVEEGDSSNDIAANLANYQTDNTNKNLLDNNANCDDNVWTNNVFDTVPNRFTKVSPKCAGNP